MLSAGNIISSFFSRCSKALKNKAKVYTLNGNQIRCVSQRGI